MPNDIDITVDENIPPAVRQRLQDAGAKARREDLRATLAAAAYAVRIQQGAGNTTNGGDRRKYAATEAVADADALLSALGR